MATNRFDLIRMMVAQFNEPTILRGTLRKTGNHTRLTIDLINAVDDQGLWTRTYNCDKIDLPSLPSDLVRGVTAALEIPLPALEQQQTSQALTHNPESYDAYLQGKFHLRLTDEANNPRAIEMLERAVKLDTNFALAYARLGEAYLARLGSLKPSETDLGFKAKRAIDTALFLDPKLAEAHFTYATFLWSPGQGFQGEPAIKQLQIALELDQQCEEAKWTLSIVYHHIGLVREAVKLANEVIKDNPLEPKGHWLKAVALAFQSDYEPSLIASANTDGDHWIPALGDWLRAWDHFQLGHTDEANGRINRFFEKHPSDIGGLFSSLRAMLLAQAGDVTGAEQEIAHAIGQKEHFVHFHHTAYQIACAYALMNKPDQAIHWLTETAGDGFNCHPLFDTDPNLKSLRDRSEFKDLLAKAKAQTDYYRRLGKASSGRDQKQ
jgi:tetratricopeptide (TPR) repeat protein